jgi:predicted DNA-binding transcriptional regulator AlpA
VPVQLPDDGFPLSPNKASHAPRRGLSRTDAARYIGISPSKFDTLVKDGRMPRPKRLDGRVLWDVVTLDLAFDCLPEDSAPEAANTWADL